MIKSIFARPVFINPQAYLVIPQLANLSMLEPIDFTSTNTYSFESLGKVESKIISAKDEYILHIDLYELNGSCVLGEFYIGPATIGSIDDFTITTNGYITTIEVGGGDSGNIVYPGLIAAWSAKGKTNDDEDRAILKDLTGNGHDVTLNGFAFSEMSGYGGYNLNFKNYNKANSIVNSIIESNRIILNPEDSDLYYVHTIYGTTEINSFTCSIKGIQEKGVLVYEYANSTENKKDTVLIDSDGIYTIPKSDKVTATYQVGFRIKKKFINQIVIELLPEYPDALVFDGVDDYGINENIPILTDYTVIVNRRYIETETRSCLISKAAGVGKGAFIMELIEGDSNKTYNYSFNNPNISKLYINGISWLNTTSYNGIRVVKDDAIDTNSIIIGRIRKKDSRIFKGAFYSAYLFDRSLDEQEIKEFIRKYIDPEYLLPSEQTTE